MLQDATFKSYVKTFPPVQFSQNKQLVLQAWGMADRMGDVCVWGFLLFSFCLILVFVGVGFFGLGFFGLFLFFVYFWGGVKY